VIPRPILPIELQVFGAVVLVGLLARLVYLVRYKRLSLRDSLMWLVSTSVALVFTVFPQSLVWVAGVLEIEVPANALFALAFLYVLLNLLSLTIGLSGNANRVRRVAQECALLRAEVETLRAELNGSRAVSERRT
jgi:hypothetical protein